MYIEAYETSSKRFVRNVHHRSLRVIFRNRRNKYTAISGKVVGKKHQSSRDKAERCSGHSMKFCILA